MLSLTLIAAPAKQTEASVHFEAAAEFYAHEDYANAAREFSIAYALEPRVDTLFAWAQAERLADHDEDALKLYERLLAGELSATQRAAIETLRDETSGELVIARAQQANESESPVADSDSTRAERTRPDSLGMAMTGIGAGLTLLGGGLLVGAGVSDSRLRTAQTYPEFEAALDPQTGRGRGAVALYASGGVLAAAGLTALIVGVVRLTRARRAPAVAMAPVVSRDQLGLLFVFDVGGWR